MVYFIWDKKSKAVKIGTTGDMKSRMRVIQSGNPNKLVLLLVLKEDETLNEAILHDLFKECRIKREKNYSDWFHSNFGLFKVIYSLKAFQECEKAHKLYCEQHPLAPDEIRKLQEMAGIG